MALPKVTKFSMKGCSWCEKWDIEEKPFLHPCEFSEDNSGGKSVYPSFRITHNDKTVDLDGYQTALDIQQAVRRLEEN